MTLLVSLAMVLMSSGTALGRSPRARAVLARPVDDQRPGRNIMASGQPAQMAANLIHIKPQHAPGPCRGGTHLARPLHAGPEQALLQDKPVNKTGDHSCISIRLHRDLQLFRIV
ncbi:MAG: hypothetical protein ACOVN4_06655 [Bosea sp. (in: a-proteobacteria)]